MKMIRCGNCHQRVLLEDQTECPECGHPVSASLRENLERGLPLSEVHLKKLNLALMLFMGVILLAFLNLAFQIVNAIWLRDSIIILGSWWLQGLFLLGAGVGVLLLAWSRNLGVWLTALGFGLFGFSVVLLGPPKPGDVTGMNVLVAGCLLLPVLLGGTLAVLKPSFTAIGIPLKTSEPIAVALLGFVSLFALVFDFPSAQGAPGIVLLCIVSALCLILVRMLRLLQRTRRAIPVP